MEKQLNQPVKKAGRLSTALIVLIAILTITVLSIAVLGVLQANHIIDIFGNGGSPSSSQTQPTLKGGGTATDGTYTPATGVTKTLSITDKVGSSMKFSSGKKGTKGDWVYENEKQNTVIVQAQVYVGNQLEAESVPIKPGQYIQNIILQNNLSPGSYTSTVYLNYYDVSTQKYLSTSGYKVSMTVG